MQHASSLTRIYVNCIYFCVVDSCSMHGNVNSVEDACSMQVQVNCPLDFRTDDACSMQIYVRWSDCCAEENAWNVQVLVDLFRFLYKRSKQHASLFLSSWSTRIGKCVSSKRAAIFHSLSALFYVWIILKGTQEWEFFGFDFEFCTISLRFCIKNFLIGPVLEKVRFFRVVLGLRGMKNIFELGQKLFFLFSIFIFLRLS